MVATAGRTGVGAVTTMNHFGRIAWVTSLSVAAAFGSAFLGCGSSTNDTTSTGAAGTMDAASGGAAGATSGSTGATASGGSTSTGSGGAAGNGIGGATSNADASIPDAGVEASGPEASADGGSQDEASDALGQRDASMSIDASTIDVASPEGGVESGSPDGSGSDGCNVNTVECFKTRDKPDSSPETKCSQCMTDNGCFDVNQMGGTCEDTPGTADAACATAIGSSSAPTEAQLCLRTLKDIFSSQCAATQQLTPCLCGTTDAGECLAGNVTPNGPLYDIYKCQLGTTGPQIASNFTIQTFGTGQANALAQCAGAFGCDCF